MCPLACAQWSELVELFLQELYRLNSLPPTSLLSIHLQARTAAGRGLRGLLGRRSALPESRLLPATQRLATHTCSPPAPHPRSHRRRG